MFLTAVELQELTGYRRPSAQRRWLEQNGVPFYLNGQRRPVVARGHIVPSERARPDLSKLRV